MLLPLSKLVLCYQEKSYNNNQNINDESVKHINNALIELKKYINRKKILEMKIRVK